MVLPTNQVPWKIYYKRNLRKKIGSPTDQLAAVEDFEPSKIKVWLILLTHVFILKCVRMTDPIMLFQKIWEKRTVLMRLRSKQKLVVMRLNMIIQVILMSMILLLTSILRWEKIPNPTQNTLFVTMFPMRVYLHLSKLSQLILTLPWYLKISTLL